MCMPSKRVPAPPNVSRIRDKNNLLYVTIIDRILQGGHKQVLKPFAPGLSQILLAGMLRRSDIVSRFGAGYVADATGGW
jgi:hypothetical protein